MTDVFEVVYATTDRSSRVLIGERLENLKNFIPVEKSIIITDSNVYFHYKNQFPDCPVLVMNPGESNKTMDTVSRLQSGLIDLGCDRSSYIVGIGGGIVTDTAGFVASTFLRGVRFGFVSSTLLSQVDASVGGKNGVNHQGYKNMIGTFNQPDFVICDIEMFATLPDHEIVNGLGEVVKHALIADAEMFNFIQKNINAINERDYDALRHLIIRSVEIKTAVVTEDEREKGRRRLLNFGHTLGHALEKSTEIDHGRAITLGMEFAARISCMRGMISKDDVHSIELMTKALKMPQSVTVSSEDIKKALLKDKKRETDDIHFVLLDAIGSACIERLTIQEVEGYVDALCMYQ
ncbi:MAG: 3-dehydroquinate synthase [Spirochaetes bacterium]|jgi:3-dehydroquinate synthase|nr:3-dehydroquinate synthase [Spirochaetota bacterium]